MRRQIHPQIKPVRELNEARLEYCRVSPCLVSEYGTTEAALEHRKTCPWVTASQRCDPAHSRHQANSGMATKPSDDQTFPLCRPLHEEFDHGRGYDAFIEKYGIDIPFHIQRINREFWRIHKPQIERVRRLPSEPSIKFLRIQCVCGLIHDLKSGQLVRYGAGVRYQCPKLGTFKRVRLCG